MAVVPEASRREIIATALAAQAGDAERIPLPWKDSRENFPVVKVTLDAVVLNPHSHRIKAHLESHPRAEVVQNDPFGEEAQEILAEILRGLDGFDEICKNLRQEGQRDAGVASRAGLLVNANRRAVALREVEEQYIRVAVLHEDASQKEIDQLELRLQMQQDFRRPYTFTNELLFVFDLTNTYDYGPEKVALELGWSASEDEREIRKGRRQVEQYLRMLNLVREVQTRSSDRIPLTDFDGRKESIIELDEALQGLEGNPEEARRLKEMRFAAMLLDLGYELLRYVDEDFVGDHLYPYLTEDEWFGPSADALTRSIISGQRESPPGVDVLEDESQPNGDVERDPRPLLDLVIGAARDGRVQLPGTSVVLDADSLRERLLPLVSDAAREAREARSYTSNLDAPLAYLEGAIKKLTNADERLDRVHDQPGLNVGRLRYLAKKAFQQAQALKERADQL